MSYKVGCIDLKTESFTNGDSKTWNIKTIEIDALRDKHGISKDYQDLFYDLLGRGFCYTHELDRAERVASVLEAEGFKVLRNWE